MAKRNNSNPVSNGSGVEGVFAVYQYFTRVKLTAMPDRFSGGFIDGFGVTSILIMGIIALLWSLKKNGVGFVS